MTSDPQAPNAPAVYLNYEEYMDVPGHFDRCYGRIKILSQKGIEEFSDVELAYPAGIINIRGVEGRTIHSDGTIVPFTGQPHQKELVRTGGVKEMAKVFSMPDVQVGSILEYQYEVQYDDRWIFWPEWYLQKRVFVHQAHYHFRPAALDVNSTYEIMVPDPEGHLTPATRLVYDQQLPPGAKVQDLSTGFDLDVKDVPPIPDEPWSPPLNSFSYRLCFFYTGNYSAQEFWKGGGKAWSKDLDRFAAASGPIQQAVAQIVSPGYTDDQKLHKIYAAVMNVENTDFSRKHTEQENKVEGAKEKTAADIWAQKRGNSVEINRLFIAMVRAAGLKASGMAVTQRDKRILNASYLSWKQLTDEIAIVDVGGREVYFDPGERYCDYGKLHWKHTQVMGIRQTDGGTEPVLTPAADYKDTVIDRRAALELAQDGTLTGTITYSMTGEEALRWRQVALREDADEARRQFDDDLQKCVPPGVIVKADHFDALTDDTQPLVAQVNVSGSMGTATGKRVFLPSSFFEAGVKPRFAEETRLNPVDLHYPYAVRDTVKITLASGLTVESVPSSTQIPFPQSATYVVKYAQSGSLYEQGRLLAVGKTVYSKDQYPQLRDFFDKANAQDQQPVILDRTATTTTAAAGDAGKSE
ncbi:MAG: DUF3857 domain-containing protein [Acidobacteriaceae bacterium]